MKVSSDELPQINCAVLFADIYEYSKHTEVREDETHRNLKTQLENACQIINKNNGSLARSHGDSIIATFSSPTDAVYCAVEINASSNRINFKIREEEQLKFRIGISYGDVINDINGEPYGNVVNIASRLENLANPGEILISNSLCKKLDNSIPFFCCYYGKVKLNNINKDVKVFKVLQHKPISDRWYDLKNKTLRLEALNVKYLFSLSLVLSFISIIVLIFTVGFISSYNDNYIVVRKEVSNDDATIKSNELTQETDLRLYMYLVSIAEQSILDSDYGRAEEYLDKATALFPDRVEAFKKRIEILEQKNNQLIDFKESML